MFFVVVAVIFPVVFFFWHFTFLIVSFRLLLCASFFFFFLLLPFLHSFFLLSPFLSLVNYVNQYQGGFSSLTHFFLCVRTGERERKRGCSEIVVRGGKAEL